MIIQAMLLKHGRNKGGDNMSLDEAINHLTESLSETEKWKDCEDCRKEHEQLLKWLIELKIYKEKEELI